VHLERVDFCGYIREITASLLPSWAQYVHDHTHV